jgi:peptidyl-prolyl cis-trans isomerase SurA
VIVMSELEEGVALYRREARLDAPPTAKELDEIQRTILERMVNDRLEVQEARREKIEVTDEDLRPSIEDFIKRNGGDKDKLEAQMRAQGLTWDAIKRQFREQQLAQRIRSRRVTRRSSITEAEVDAYLAENRGKLEAGLKYHARHIAILAEPPDSPAAWDRAKAEIDEIARELQGGADFATLARERSKDASAATGGDLGWLTRGELEPVFEDVILKVPKGGVTPAIKSAAGYHLFKVEEREDLTAEMLTDARQQARDILLQKKAQERRDEWVEGLRRRALITIRL